MSIPPSRLAHIPLLFFRTAIREYDAKLLLAYWLERAPAVDANATIKTNFAYPSPKVAQVSWDPETDAITPDTQLPGWVFNTKLVAKPDQLIKRRGKAGLLALNKTWDEAKGWVQQRAGKPQKVSLLSSRLLCAHFPFVPLSLRPFSSLSHAVLYRHCSSAFTLSPSAVLSDGMTGSALPPPRSPAIVLHRFLLQTRVFRHA